MWGTTPSVCVCARVCLCVSVCACLWVICHHHGRKELPDRGQSNLHHRPLIHRKCMHKAPKDTRAHDNLQSSSACFAFAEHFSSWHARQQQQWEIYAKSPGKNYLLSTYQPVVLEIIPGELDTSCHKFIMKRCLKYYSSYGKRDINKWAKMLLWPWKA